jgi:hypothetical protein
MSDSSCVAERKVKSRLSRNRAGSVLPIDGPHQRPVVVVVVGGDLLITFAQGFGTPIIFQDVPHALAQGGIIVRVENGFVDDFSKDGQHVFFEFAVLILELLELFPS